MCSPLKTLLVIFCIFCGPACKNEKSFSPTSGQSDTDTDVESDTGSDADIDTDADIDSDTDSDIDESTESDSETAFPLDTTGADTADTDTADIALDSDTTEIPPSFCLEHTADKTECADCCDCMVSDCSQRASCREQCANAVLEHNDDIIEIEVPTDRGTDGDYTDCFMRGDELECKSCCDCATVYACGDYKYCRENCESMF